MRNGFVGVATPYYVEKGIPYLQSNNIRRNKIDKTQMVYINKEFHEKHEKSMLKENDILVVQSGHAGECTVVPKEFEGCNCHALIIMSPKDITSINSTFCAYYLNSPVGIKKLFPLITGNTIKHILASEMKKLRINLPSLNEQNKLSHFLSIIDKKIDLLENKLQAYMDFKKYLMQQIFAQKLRFDFDDEWKQYKLKDLLSVKSSSISINQLEDNTGEYPLYGASGFLKNIDFCEMETDYISIVKDGSGVGNLSYHEKNSSIVNTSQYLLPKKDFDIHFLYYQLQTLNLLKYVNGSSIPHIYFKDYCIEKVTVPSLPEQQQIGKLFVDTDKTLENIDNCIRATQEFKKGLLQQMFV